MDSALGGRAVQLGVMRTGHEAMEGRRHDSEPERAGQIREMTHSNRMGRAALCAFMCSLLTASLAAQAQPAGKVYRIGVLLTSTASEPVNAFKQKLRDLGYVESRNLAIEFRSTEGKYER